MHALMFFIVAMTTLGVFFGFCGFAIFCLIHERFYPEQKGRFYTKPDPNTPPYREEHCDGYSAGNFYWW